MSTCECAASILAGGHGLPLFQLTKVTNKHLLPVGRVADDLPPAQEAGRGGHPARS